MKKVKQTCQGIELSSSFNKQESEHRIDINKINFAICRATGGTHFIDPIFKSEWYKLVSKWKVVGAYHVYLSQLDPMAQANHFTNTMQPVTWGNNIKAVAIDEASIEDETTESTEEVQRNFRSFLDTVEKSIGQPLTIRTNLKFANTYLNEAYFGRYPLWIIDNAITKEPEMPKAWSNGDWTFWQYAVGSGNLMGGTINLNLFNGSAIELDQFINGDGLN